MFNGKVILITGGTGSFGTAFVDQLLKEYEPRKVIIFSRDEYKQYEMSKKFAPEKYKPLRYFLGDVRDFSRLTQALHGVDIIVHAAALKQVPAAEYNPFEFIKTNINGAENIVNAAILSKVKKVIALSTDKAASPINLYGATKLVSDKIFVAANYMYGDAETRFSVVRYGNVVGSRGSVIPFFKQIVANGGRTLPITDPRMTRFWITLEQSVKFVMYALQNMSGGEIFVPKIPSVLITDIAKAIGPKCDMEIVGIRPGEKLHEIMVSSDDSINTFEFDNHYRILPTWRKGRKDLYEKYQDAKQVMPDFEYSSDKNTHFLTVDDLESLKELLH